MGLGICGVDEEDVMFVVGLLEYGVLDGFI